MCNFLPPAVAEKAISRLVGVTCHGEQAKTRKEGGKPFA
jgi:hypothetical protein